MISDRAEVKVSVAFSPQTAAEPRLVRVFCTRVFCAWFMKIGITNIDCR